jgi:hypothetical protein
MAGFVKRSSAERWNRTAAIVEGLPGSHRVPGPYRPPQGAGGGGGGGELVIVIARATADVAATASTFAAKIKATISGPPQTFDADITVENFNPGDFTTPTVAGDYVTTSTDNVFLLLEGMNFFAIKANTDSVSFPASGAPKTGWFIFQAPGVFV